MDNVKLGKNVLIKDGFKIIGNGEIIIEDDVIIDSNVTLITSFIDYYDRSKTNTGKILIKKNAYIGTNSLIYSNITIGNNSYVMPNSVVLSDVFDNKIVAGNPANEINELDQNKFNNKDTDDSLNIFFKGNDYIIGKDINNDLYYLSNDKRILLASNYEINVLDLIDDLLFILGDKIKVFSLCNLEKPFIYYSSYYNNYYKAKKYNDVYLINTDDSDIIVAYKKDNNILFKRVFDYEINKLDNIINTL